MVEKRIYYQKIQLHYKKGNKISFIYLEVYYDLTKNHWILLSADSNIIPKQYSYMNEFPNFRELYFWILREFDLAFWNFKVMDIKRYDKEFVLALNPEVSGYNEMFYYLESRINPNLNIFSAIDLFKEYSKVFAQLYNYPNKINYDQYLMIRYKLDDAMQRFFKYYREEILNDLQQIADKKCNPDETIDLIRKHRNQTNYNILYDLCLGIDFKITIYTYLTNLQYEYK
jgi:hypothetical protein